MAITYAIQVAHILSNLGGQAAAPHESAVAKAARSITSTASAGRKKEYGRNDRVVITNGKEEIELKYKKAELLLRGGEWRIVV